MPNESKPKKVVELLRFALPVEGITIERLERCIETAGAGPRDTIRHYNGQLRIEEQTQADRDAEDDS